MVDAFLGTELNPPQPVPQGDIMALPYVGCKTSMFSFVRLAKADPILGVEMASTGEVGVFGHEKHEAFLKALIASRFVYPTSSVLVAIDRAEDCIQFLPYVKKLASKYIIYATPLTATILRGSGCPCTILHLPENHHVEPTVLGHLKKKLISLVIQLRDKSRDFVLRHQTEETASQDYYVRRYAVDFNTPLVTEIRLAELLTDALLRYEPKDLEVLPYDAYVPHVTY
eukprot:TRINITY_DN9593_c0_g1_i2.p1 TRINITY_DN9593_c0_g1~~TRINITY_DN9593_c0_g1_i2.p1  ORF type:complete len:227 (-),score=34.88 TRINITY_DN9593_c0_g1_i2:837-1517(-)